MRKVLSRENVVKWKDLLLKIYVSHIPPILIYLALMQLVFLSYYSFLKEGNFTTLLTTYLSGIGLILGFANVTFSYARVSDENRQLTSVGECFLYAGVAMVAALLIGWLSYKVDQQVKEISLYQFIRFPLIIVFSWGQSFLLFTANALHKGLVYLEKHLFAQVKERIR